MLLAAAWVLTVSGASTLTWSVISAAGARAPLSAPAPTSVATSRPAGSAGGTWSGRGGRLTATCTHDAISLATAVPDDGYWAKVYDPGPATLRVDFESTDPDDRHEVRLTATCQDGNPVFDPA